MRAGSLRQRVGIQSYGATLDDYGDPAASWTTDATVWAAVDTIGGSEQVIGGELSGVATHKVTMRYRSGVDASNQLVHDSRTLRILEVRNWQERGIRLEVICQEVAT